MFYAKWLLIGMLLLLSGCQDITDDLNPSGEDQRPDVEAGSVGYQVSQIAPDFTLQDSLDTQRVLSEELLLGEPVVLYFTMWCPICDSHMSHMISAIMPNYPNVNYFFVDYVSGSVALARSNQLANGYGNYQVLVDESEQVKALLHATMGTTIVIGADGVIRMNEDYRDGSKLYQILGELP